MTKEELCTSEVSRYRNKKLRERGPANYLISTTNKHNDSRKKPKRGLRRNKMDSLTQHAEITKCEIDENVLPT